VHEIITDQNDYLSLRLSGKVDKKEYKQVLSYLKSKVSGENKVDLLVDLSELDKFTMGALWEDIKFDVTNFKVIRRFAIIGDSNTIKVLDPISEPFVIDEAKFFNKSEFKEAERWVHNS